MTQNSHTQSENRDFQYENRKNYLKTELNSFNFKLKLIINSI